MVFTEPTRLISSRDTIPGSTVMDTKLRQRVRYLRTEDGVQLAWAESARARS